MHAHFQSENVKDKDNLGDPGVDGRIELKWILSQWKMSVWTAFNWLRIRTGGGLLSAW
jgi:hypothetical protein